MCMYSIYIYDTLRAVGRRARRVPCVDFAICKQRNRKWQSSLPPFTSLFRFVPLDFHMYCLRDATRCCYMYSCTAAVSECSIGYSYCAVQYSQPINLFIRYNYCICCPGHFHFTMCALTPYHTKSPWAYWRERVNAVSVLTDSVTVTGVSCAACASTRLVYCIFRVFRQELSQRTVSRQ
jgi:hypothetical protein